MSDHGTSGCADLEAQANVEAPVSDTILVLMSTDGKVAPVIPAGEGERVVYAETVEL